MQIAFTVPLGMLVALVAAGNREGLFFPASVIIVGAHYLPFTYLYGMRLFAVLGSVLVASGITLALRLPNSFSLGARVTAGILTAFAFLLRRSHLSHDAQTSTVADATTTDGMEIDGRHEKENQPSGQRSVSVVQSRTGESPTP